MARIAFVQRLAFEYLGTAQLAAVLREGGHQVRVVIAGSARRAAEAALTYRPNVLCFSCTTGSQGWCLSVAHAVKEALPCALVVLGGPHPTFFPEIIHEPEVDAICIGEGEDALAQIASRTEAGEPLDGIENLWHTRGGEVVREELAPLHEDLDALPMPDRSIYYRRYPHLNLSRKPFFAGRGCPFRCAFCFNQNLRELFRGKGSYVRRRSPDAVVDEILHVRRRYGLCTVYMQDDTFTLSTPWLGAFAEVYAARVGLPLVCLARADLIGRETVALLKRMSCRSVFFGVESGDERIRQTILRKTVTDDQIRAAASLLKSSNIRVRTYNMLGIPTESLSDAWKTVQLNAEVQPTFPWCSIFQPYPRTELGDRAIRMGLIPDADSSVGATFFRESALDLPHKREIANLHKLFFWAVKFPWLQPLVRLLTPLPSNRLFDLAFLIGYAYGFMRTECLRWGEVVSTALRNVGPVFSSSNKS